MNNTLRFDFTEINTVKSSVPLAGRGIRFICTQLDGTFCYSVTDSARARLRKEHAYVYTNDNGQEVRK